MENQTVKDLIDKLLIDEIDSVELKELIQSISGNKELVDYYNRTKKMKEELDKISEQLPFNESELSIERNKLFAKIHQSGQIYKLWHLAAAAVITAGLTLLLNSLFLNTDNQLIPESSNLISFNIEQINSTSFAITGKQISDFKIQGNINDPKIQRILLQTINQSNNLGSRINAIDLLTQSRNQRIISSFINLAMNDQNTALRLKAIDALQPFLTNDTVQESLIKLIQEDSDDIIRIAAFNQLNNLPLTKETKPVYENLIEKNSNEYIRQTALKRLIKGEI